MAKKRYKIDQSLALAQAKLDDKKKKEQKTQAKTGVTAAAVSKGSDFSEKKVSELKDESKSINDQIAKLKAKYNGEDSADEKTPKPSDKNDKSASDGT